MKPEKGETAAALEAGKAGLDISGASLPDEEEQRRTRIAWLYYVEGKTQSEIGEALRLSRVKVNRELAICRDSGLVQIRINGRLAGCVALERKLQSRYGLADAVVVPTPADPEGIALALGMAVGAYVSDRLKPGMTVGIGWGRTLRCSIRAMRRRHVPRLTVVSLMGGLGRASELNTYETASHFAELHDATCYYLAAPTFADSVKLRDMLLDQARMREVYDRCRRADMTIASVGGLGRHNRIHSLGLLTAAEQRSLASAGAVGDYLCHFLDRDGALVKHPVNGRVVGVSPRDLSAVPTRILASGGAEKTTILRATLAAGYATVLITDEKAARLLVGGSA
ncbi:MAG TPA: sugar-binding transcriptional regulator [Dongiaceae bacterium]